MSDSRPDAPDNLPAAVQRRRGRMSAIWVIPIVAVLVAGYLAFRTWSEEGPTITISFESAEGLTAGQTLVKHKNVTMGTLRSIKLSKDLSHVVLRVDMNKEAAPHLTTGTRFWVVMPRLGLSGVSGLDTLVSGAYIEMDPGTGDPTDHFEGLETPPIVRSGIPGKEYLLVTPRLGALAPGSPVFFRDIQVGEVLGYDLDNIETSVTLHVFVRSPFDVHVFEGTHFWNASGVSLTTGPDGFQLQIESLEAVLAGGIAFDTPVLARVGEPAKDGTLFTLYKDATTAAYAGASRSDQYIIHFDGSVQGLSPGADVRLRGIRIGRVVDLRMQYDANTNEVRIPVLIELDAQETEIVGIAKDTREILSNLIVERGLRAQMQASSLITGQQLVALDFFPEAPPASLGEERGYPVIPSVPSDLDSIMHAVQKVAAQLSALPLDDLVDDARNTIESVDKLINGPEVKTVLVSLADTLASADELLKSANRDLGPALAEVPKAMHSVRAALKEINALLTSIDQGYGNESSFQRDLTSALLQAQDALRAIRVLAEFLEQNPQALILGTSGD